MNELGSKVSLSKQRVQNNVVLNLSKLQKSVDEISYSPRKMRDNDRLVNEIKGHFNARTSEMPYRSKGNQTTQNQEVARKGPG